MIDWLHCLDLTGEKAYEIARSMEAAYQHFSELQIAYHEAAYRAQEAHIAGGEVEQVIK